MNQSLNETPDKKAISLWKLFTIPIALFFFALAGSKFLDLTLQAHSLKYLVLTSLAIAIITLILGLAIIEFGRRKSTNILPAEDVFLARIIVFLTTFFFMLCISMIATTRQARWADTIAIEAATYAQEHFEQIDRNQDGNILVEELDHFSSTASLTAKEEEEKLTFLKWDFNRVGHILEQHYSGKYLEKTYAINKADLDIYKADYKPRSTSNTRRP